MKQNGINRLDEVMKAVDEDKLTQLAYDKFKSLTPVKSGNARQSTIKSSNSILANYPYAEILDAGRGFRDGQMRGSTQAPKGMSEPTLAFIRDYLSKKLDLNLRK